MFVGLVGEVVGEVVAEEESEEDSWTFQSGTAGSREVGVYRAMAGPSRRPPWDFG